MSGYLYEINNHNIRIKNMRRPIFSRLRVLSVPVESRYMTIKMMHRATTKGSIFAKLFMDSSLRVKVAYLG